MTARFLTTLKSEEIECPGRGGSLCLRVTEDLPYESEVLAARIVVPAGFVSDGFSAPDGPAGSWFIRNISVRAAVVHDWLYGGGLVNGAPVSRKAADAVLREAMEAVGAPAWKLPVAWIIVRLFGGGHFHHQPTEESRA